MVAKMNSPRDSAIDILEQTSKKHFSIKNQLILLG